MDRNLNMKTRGHHDPSSGVFRGGGSKTSILPGNAEELYKHAIPDAQGKHWYAMDENGVIHRYGNSNNGKVHWNGDTSQNRGIPVPQEVKQRFEKMKKMVSLSEMAHVEI